MTTRISRSRKLYPFVVLCVLFLASVLAIDCFAFGSDTENLPPLYLMIVVHNEEDTSRGGGGHGAEGEHPRLRRQ